LRLRIARTGCVTAAALVVHSGVPALDSAALQWFESSQFSPASSNGRAIDSELSLRIVFKLED
jgi:TonB family protein